MRSWCKEIVGSRPGSFANYCVNWGGGGDMIDNDREKNEITYEFMKFCLIDMSSANPLLFAARCGRPLRAAGQALQ